MHGYCVTIMLPEYNPAIQIGAIRFVQSLKKSASHIHNGIQEFQIELATLNPHLASNINYFF